MSAHRRPQRGGAWRPRGGDNLNERLAHSAPETKGSVMVFEQVWTDLPPRPVDAQFIVDFNAGLADIWCENEADDDSWAREKAYRDAVRGAGDPSERAVYLLEREAMGQVADASSRLLAADGIVQRPLVFERVLPAPNGVVMWDYPGEYIGFSWHVKDEERIVILPELSRRQCAHLAPAPTAYGGHH